MADSDLADHELRQELLKFDVTVGKITTKNRDILIKQLNHQRARQRAAELPPSPSRSPGRQSTSRAKKSPPRQSHVPMFSSSDEDDSSPRATEKGTQRQKNVRRRTVESSSVKDMASTPGRTRGMTSLNESVSEPRRSQRQSLGANSPFLAGSLLNPMLPPSSTSQNGRGPRSGRRVDDSMHDGEFSGSDDEYSYVDVADAAVNTSASLRNVGSSASACGDLRSQRGKNKPWTSASGESCSRLWQYSTA